MSYPAKTVTQHRAGLALLKRLPTCLLSLLREPLRPIVSAFIWDWGSVTHCLRPHAGRKPPATQQHEMQALVRHSPKAGHIDTWGFARWHVLLGRRAGVAPLVLPSLLLPLIHRVCTVCMVPQLRQSLEDIDKLELGVVEFLGKRARTVRGRVCVPQLPHFLPCPHSCYVLLRCAARGAPGQGVQRRSVLGDGARAGHGRPHQVCGR